MKRFLLSAVGVCLCSAGVMAQSATSYFMPDVVERRNLNVALAPERGYFAIPIVGSTSFNIDGNLSLSSVLYEVGDDLVTLMDSRISAAEALGNLSEGANFSSISNRTEILSFGRYKSDKKTFWSFNLALRTNANVSIPYEFFEFVKLGEDGNIQDLSIYMESFMDVGFGYSKMIGEKLTVGARVKFLAGLANASVNVSNFDVMLNSSSWSADIAAQVDMYAPGLQYDGAVGQELDFDDIEMNGFSPAGYGAAIDLGAEYAVTDKLKVSLAANDIGFISWSKSSNVSAAMSTTQSFAGVDVDGNGNSSIPDFDLDDMVFYNQGAKSTTRFLQANINAAAEYKFLDELIGVGVLYSAKLWKSKTTHDVIASANIRPLSWFTFAASYDFVNNSSNSVGLAANFSPCWINFYVAADILTSRLSSYYIPIEQSSMSVSFGLAIPVGARSLRSKYTKL